MNWTEKQAADRRIRDEKIRRLSLAGMTQEEVGAAVGVTGARVCQIRQRQQREEPELENVVA